MLKDAINRRLRLYFGVLFNMVFLDVLKLIFAVFVAFLFGKLISKLKLPAILGWLLAGMTLGPHALGLLNEPMMEAAWYTTAESILECVVGLMIGTELIWRKIKKAGKQIDVTTITESLGTFLVVSLVFGVIFGITGVPLYLAFLFGGIALATAPAPSLSIVNEMKTAGPVTSTLIPMAALDDLVGALVFFTVVALVSAHVSTAGIPVLAGQRLWRKTGSLRLRSNPSTTGTLMSISRCQRNWAFLKVPSVIS